MAYNKEELEKLALKAIEDHKPPFISHLVAYLPCSSSTFYDLGLEKSELIKDAINKVKVSLKTKLLKDMLSSDSASAQIASYKLLSDDNEFHKLSGQQIDHRSNGNELKSLTSEERISKIEQLQKALNVE